MTRKKSALGCRVLSIVLSLLMILCAVPLVSFAANGEDAGPVLEKSREDVFLFRALRPFSGEPYTVGSKLGDCAINKTGVALQVPKPGTIQYINYLTTKLTVEFVNKEDTVKHAGTNTEPVIIYVTADPSIWVKVNYEFEAVEGSGIPEAVIETLPTIDSTSLKYTEGLKVSDLTMNTEGAKATVNGAPIEGTFSFTEPDKTLGVGNNNVSVTFTPADPTAAEPATGVISVSVAKGDIQVLQTPVITIEYGTRLKNVSLRDFKVETIPASGVSWDWLGADGSLTSLSDPRADQVLAVGTYDDILVRAYTVYNNKYDVTLIPVKVVVNPVSKEFPMLCEMDEAARRIIVTGRGNSDAKGAVTYTLHSDALAEDLVIEGKGVQDVATFQLDDNAKSGAYTVTATYTAGEKDPCNYASAAKQLDISFFHNVAVTGGSGSGDYQAGSTVYVMIDAESIKKNYEFKSWKITNANGDTIDVGVEDLTQRDISFVMPDEAVKVEAQASFSIQLFFENLGNSILSFIMKIVEWFQGTLFLHQCRVTGLALVCLGTPHLPKHPGEVMIPDRRFPQSLVHAGCASRG